MILIREKIESVTKEVGLIDAVSSSPASKEIMVFYTLLDTLVPVFIKIYPLLWFYVLKPVF